MGETIEIAKELYLDLFRRSCEMDAMERVGVDNWIGCEEVDWEDIDELVEREAREKQGRSSTMPKFRKKSVVVEAIQLVEGNGQEVEEFLGDNHFEWEIEVPDSPGSGYQLVGILISALESLIRARVGDWIVRGVAKEIYLCKPEIFAATYEEVEDGN